MACTGLVRVERTMVGRRYTECWGGGWTIVEQYHIRVVIG